MLIVEDESGLAGALRIGLEREGYAVDLADSCAQAREKLSVWDYDVLLLDINLPDGDGFTLAEQIRAGQAGSVAGPDMRILMLTARSRLPDRVRGLDSGADDYLVKPFALAELSARLRAILRREVRAVSSSVIEVADVRLDTARQLARRGERELPLTRKEFALLRYLMSKPGHLVAAEELLEHVWDENADPFTQTVRVTVGTLRRKLSSEGEPQLLETVVGRGYRLREEPPGAA
ncbi:DNA-binding response regulator [Kineosporia sp. NBRC 101677]|nr:response regulator transcription factor [Kineosporia rhizophila]GLY19804.1 DNA-binding response regulator [Kineosporia sp. NBRC 101677]